jgi:hypothetical protein
LSHASYNYFTPCPESHIHFHSTAAALPFFELARTIAANYKTVDKETKVFCETVSKLIKQRHAYLTAADKLGAQEGLPKKKVKGKELPLTLVEGDVVPRVQATAAKTRSDTKLPTRVLNAPVVVHSPGTSTATSNVMTRTNSTDSLGTFAGSGASQESNKNGVTPPPFWQNYPDVQRMDRIQEMDILNSSDDIHAMMTEQLDQYRRFKSVYVNAGFDVDKIARENMQRDANLEAMRTRSPPQLQDIEALRHLHQNDMHRRVPRPRSPSGTVWPEVEHPVIANVNRRASIMADMMREKLVALTCKEGEEVSPVTSTHVADMMRARLMALTCKEEEETNPDTQINLPGPPFHLPLCQPIQNDHDVSMLCQPTID